MRGTDLDQGGLFSYVSMEQWIPPTHPLRSIRALLDEALGSISRDFDRVHAEGGRESVWEPKTSLACATRPLPVRAKRTVEPRALKSARSNIVRLWQSNR